MMLFFKKNIFLFLFFLNISLSFGQKNIWTVGTAKTLPKKQFDLPIFQPCRYGLTETLEISTHPILFFIQPNIALKKQWFKWKDIIFSTKHGFHYPTFMFSVLKETDTNGKLPDTTQIPNIFAFRNEILMSRFLVSPTTCTPANYLLTLKIGHQFAIEKGSSTLPSFDETLLYRRTSIYLPDSSFWYIGLDLDWNYSKKKSFSADLDYFSIGDFYELQHKFLIIFHRKKNFSIIAGYQLTYGDYPDGNGFFLMPLVDFMWKFNRPKKREKGLFKESKLNF